MSTTKKGLCPACGGNPSIDIQEKTVHIKCKCGYLGGMEILKYYNEIEYLQSNSSIDREDIKEIQSKLLEAQNHIFYHFAEQTNKAIEKLQKQIESIQKAYQEAYTSNNLILNLLNSIIANYDGSEVMHENIIKNSDIKIYSYDESSDICDFFKNYKILNVKPTNFTINEVQEVKKIDDNHIFFNLLLLKDGRLAALNSSGLRLYDLKNDYKVVHEIRLDDVKGLCQLDNGLVATSTKSNIHFYSIEKDTSTLVFEIKAAHDGGITRIISLPKNKIASSGYGGEVRVWEVSEPYTDIPLCSLAVDNGQNGSSVIYMKEKNVIVFGLSYTLTVWNYDTYEKEKEIACVRCGSGNTIIQVDSDRVMCGDIGIFTVVNISNGNIEIKIENDILWNVKSMVRLPDNKTFLLGIGNFSYCVFDYEAIDYKVIKGSQEKGINDMLLLDDGTVFTASYDHTLKMSKIIFNDKK